MRCFVSEAGPFPGKAAEPALEGAAAPATAASAGTPRSLLQLPLDKEDEHIEII